jgi:hypothetical protein
VVKNKWLRRSTAVRAQQAVSAAEANSSASA